MQPRRSALIIWSAVLTILGSSLPMSGGYHGDNILDYVALQGDLNVPIDEHVEAVKILDTCNKTLAEWTSRHGDSVGNASFPCGVIHRAGQYRLFLLLSNGTWIIDPRELKVVWPPVSVQTPSDLTAFRLPFQVKVNWIHLKCYPPLNEVNVTAKLVHCGLNDYNNSCPAPFQRASQPVRDVWQVAGLVTDIRFECQSLDHPGLYRVLLTADDASVIGSSQSIRVHPNEEFQLQVRSRFALPCRRELTLFYRRPQQCILGGPDRVRIYGKSYATNVSFTFDYIGEKLLEQNKSATSLPCQMLDGWKFDWLCFRYVHFASDGAPIETTQTCIPSQNTSGFQEPNWGPWSEYSACTSPCGTGIRYRYRYCDRPPPQQIGSFCIGSPVEATKCQLDPCPITPEENTEDVLIVELGSKKGKKYVTNCQCGCVKELKEGSIFSLAVSSAQCANSPLSWRFTVPQSNRIRLQLDYLRLDCHRDDVLLIRDGGSPHSPLLALLQGKAALENIFESSSPVISLELTVVPTGCVAGFIATITNVHTSAMERKVVANGLLDILWMIPPPLMAIFSVLMVILSAVFVLTAWYTQCFVRLKIMRTHSSLAYDDSDYQLTSAATSLTSLLPSEAEETIPFRAANVLSNRKSHHQSLPNTPHLHRANRAQHHAMSRSSTMSPRGFRQQQNTSWRIHYPTVEIEMSKLTSCSESTLKEEKVLNTHLTELTSASPSVRSSSTAFDHDTIDLELDYYDLDVRNADCNAPDSFLRCLADDSTYWNGAVIEGPSCSPTLSPSSIVEERFAEIPFADDES